MMRKFWRVWAKALGDKASNSDKEADIIATIRTVIILINIATAFFIMANVVRHW
jgi:hypothetical protein